MDPAQKCKKVILAIIGLIFLVEFFTPYPLKSKPSKGYKNTKRNLSLYHLGDSWKFRENYLKVFYFLESDQPAASSVIINFISTEGQILVE